MTQWLSKRSLPVRIVVYAATATLAFALAAGAGAMGALTLRGDLGLLERGEPRSVAEQNADREQQKDGSAEREDAAIKQNVVASQQPAAEQEGDVASRQEEAEYVSTVGSIQARAVEMFLESHDKLLRYDALIADDVEEMQANETALQEVSDRTDDLVPPRKYQGQHEVFDSAIEELHEATRLAYVMAADPVAGAELGFDEYDGHVKEASALLQRSNELLGKDYEAIEGIREISPELSTTENVGGLESV